MEAFGPLLGYCFRCGVWVFIISEEAAAKLFQPEKDPGEQVQAFLSPVISLGGFFQPRTFTHLQSCLGNNRVLLTVYIPREASVYLLYSIAKWRQKKSACNYSYGTKPSAINFHLGSATRDAAGETEGVCVCHSKRGARLQFTSPMKTRRSGVSFQRGEG